MESAVLQIKMQTTMSTPIWHVAISANIHVQILLKNNNIKQNKTTTKTNTAKTKQQQENNNKPCPTETE